MVNDDGKTQSENNQFHVANVRHDFYETKAFAKVTTIMDKDLLLCDQTNASVSAKTLSGNGCSTELESAQQIIHKHCSSKLLKLQFEEKAIELGNSIKEKDKLECKLNSVNSKMNSVKQTLDLEHLGRQDLETKGLYHIKEAAEKDEITSLTNCIEAQRVRITELYASNSEISLKLEKVQFDLEALTAELEMLQDFKTKYNKFLKKTRELRKQSIASMENKLHEIAVKSHNQLAKIRWNLQMELTKNQALEDDLKNKKDGNYRCISKMNVAIKLAQSELKDCQDQLENLKSLIPSWDAEIEMLRVQLQMKTKQLEDVNSSEEVVKSLEKRLESLRLENEQIKIQLHSAKSNLTETLEISNDVETFYFKWKKNYSLEKILKISEQNESSSQNLWNLWKNEQELSDANLDKQIAVREAKTANEKIKFLEEDKRKMSWQFEEEQQKEKDKFKELFILHEDIKKSLAQVSKESLRNRLRANSAQRTLTQANEHIEKLQISSLKLQRELEQTQKEKKKDHNQIDALNSVNARLISSISKYTEEKSALNEKVAKLEEEVKSHNGNIDLLKNACKVLDEQLIDYENLTADYERRENTLIQEKQQLEKDFQIFEQKLKDSNVKQNDEKTELMVAKRAIEKLISDTSDIISERNLLRNQRDRYEKLFQVLTNRVSNLTLKVNEMECEKAKLQKDLKAFTPESIVKEDSSNYLTRMRELKDINQELMVDLQSSIDQRQVLKKRINKLESTLEEMQKFYKKQEIRAEGTRQHLTKLIEYLQLKLQECSDKKTIVRKKLFQTKQNENTLSMKLSENEVRLGYQELENELFQEPTKEKVLTKQLLDFKTSFASVSLTFEPAPQTPKKLEKNSKTTNSIDKKYGLEKNLKDHESLQRIHHNIPHRFNIELLMRAGKCAACLEPIHFGKRSTICSECHIKTHVKCSILIPPNCGLPKGFEKHLGKSLQRSDESISTLNGLLHTQIIDESNKPTFNDKINKSDDDKNEKNSKIFMESWVKIFGKGKASWDRKYLRLEGNLLCLYEQWPFSKMKPIFKLELSKESSFAIQENIDQAEVPGTAKSDLDFIFRVEQGTENTCWPSSRLYIMALSQVDKKSWLNNLKSITPSTTCYAKNSMLSTILKLEKNRLDLDCVVELEENDGLFIGTKEGLYFFQPSQTKFLTSIRGVNKIHQLSLHPHIGLAIMIAGKDRKLISCDLEQLKRNALATDFPRPAIVTKTILNSLGSCHLYQLKGELLCVANASSIMLLKWKTNGNKGEFVLIKELQTQEPCSCAIFTNNSLIVGCQKFFQIDLKSYIIDDFPQYDDSLAKIALAGVFKMGIFPVAVLIVGCTNSGTKELLLCYNDFGIFVDEHGQRTRSVDPTWSHLPFAVAFREPYLFIVYFSSVEVIKLTSEAFKNESSMPEKIFIDLPNLRYLGLAGSRGIYVANTNSTLDIQKIDGAASIMSRIK